MNSLTSYREAILNRTSSFSYSCKECSRCCHRYVIRVNPYEVLRLAQHCGISVSDFLGTFVTPESSLIHRSDDSCIFLGKEGCSVHAARPLVCRIYPLGRHLSRFGEESFFRMEPHPDSDGVIGTEGCVSAYLEAQGALPFLDAADRYMTVFQNYYRELSSIQKDAQFGRRASDKVDIFTAPKLELLNTDKVVARLRAVSGARNINPEIVMELHIEELEDWLSQFQAMENRDER